MGLFATRPPRRVESTIRGVRLSGTELELERARQAIESFVAQHGQEAFLSFMRAPADRVANFNTHPLRHLHPGGMRIC